MLERLPVSSTKECAFRMESGIAGLEIAVDEVETIALNLLGVVQHHDHLECARTRQREPKPRDGQTPDLSGFWQEIADGLASHREGEGGKQAQRHPEIEKCRRVKRPHRDAENQCEKGANDFCHTYFFGKPPKIRDRNQ